MSILFSAVSVDSSEGSAEFLVGGIPRDSDDLQEWDAFLEFAEALDSETEIVVHAEAYIYGEGETDYAGFDEVEELEQRIAEDGNFLSAECDNIEEVDFSFQWSPEEDLGMEMGL